MSFKKLLLSLLLTGSIVSIKAEKPTFTYTEFANEQELQSFLKDIEKGYETYDFEKFSLLHKLAALSYKVSSEERPKVIEAFKYALSKEKNINQLQDWHGNTVLHTAINENKINYLVIAKYNAQELFLEEIIDALLQAGANPNLKNKATANHLGYTARELLESAYGTKKHPEIGSFHCIESRNQENKECIKIKKCLDKMNK